MTFSRALRCHIWSKGFFIAGQPLSHVDVKHTQSGLNTKLLLHYSVCILILYVWSVTYILILLLLALYKQFIYLHHTEKGNIKCAFHARLHNNRLSSPNNHEV